MVLIQRCLLNGYMVDEWLVKSAQKYNKQSLENKDGYPAFILMPITTLEKIINWTFESLPDEILVGMDPNPDMKNPKKIDDLYRGVNFQNKLFAGQGYILGEPHLVNRGDAFSVHHVPEEWNDEIFGEERGVRGGRFTTWLHTHPNAPAIPSMADADAAQWTEGCDMILGVRFSPEGIFNKPQMQYIADFNHGLQALFICLKLNSICRRKRLIVCIPVALFNSCKRDVA